MASLCTSKKNPNSWPCPARPTLTWSVLLLQPRSAQHSLPLLILLWPHSPPLVHLPTVAPARPSHARSTPSLRSQFRCHLLRETFPGHPIGKPLSRHLCLTTVSLFLIVPFIHSWNDLVFLLAGSLIGIWTSRQRGWFCLSLYPNLAHGRCTIKICFLIYLSFRIKKECHIAGRDLGNSILKFLLL